MRLALLAMTLALGCASDECEPFIDYDGIAAAEGEGCPRLMFDDQPTDTTWFRDGSRVTVRDCRDSPYQRDFVCGDVTYHGPGQLVAYPIVLLREGKERDLHAYLRNLEEAVIRTCTRFGLSTDREPGKTGVWMTTPIGRKKLCSMGIACRKWVTFHGLALNVTTDLAYFRRINPCGFESSVMTTMSEQVGALDFAAVKTAIAEELASTLDRTAA